MIIERPDRMTLLRLALFIFSLMLAAILLLCVPPEGRVSFVRHAGYFFVLLAVVLGAAWGVLCAIAWRSSQLRSPVERCGTAFLTLCAMLLGAWVLFAHADVGYKIVMDEYILASTAENMHQTREVVATSHLLRDAPGAVPTAAGQYVDKRTWLYPFVVSVWHDIFGLSFNHAFQVNICLGLVLLLMASQFGLELGGSVAAAGCAVLLLASLPLVAQNATGGGMELLNLAMLAVTMYCAVLYLKAPSREREGLLSLAGVLLAYARYESAIFILPVGLVILLGWWRARRVLLSWATLLAPLFLVALGLHILAYLDNESAWELTRGAESAFAWRHVVSNVPHALYFFFSVDGQLANSPWLSLLGLLGLIALPSVYYHQWKNAGGLRPVHVCLALFLPFLLLQFVLVLGFHATRLDSPFVSRYALPFYWCLLLLAIFFFTHLSQQIKQTWRYALILTAVFTIMYALPSNANAPFSRKNFVVNEQVWLGALAKEKLEQDALWIDRYLVPYVLRDTASLGLLASLRHADEVLAQLKLGIYSEVYYVEHLVLAGDEYNPENGQAVAMRECFELETIAERSFRPFTLTRVCRINGLKERKGE